MPSAPPVHGRTGKRPADMRPSAGRRGYNYRWTKARAAFLRSHPLCEECKRNEKITQARVVDHITPHRGNYELFWNVKNWQALCIQCHNSKSAKEGKETWHRI